MSDEEYKCETDMQNEESADPHNEGAPEENIADEADDQPAAQEGDDGAPADAEEQAAEENEAAEEEEGHFEENEQPDEEEQPAEEEQAAEEEADEGQAEDGQAPQDAGEVAAQEDGYMDSNVGDKRVFIAESNRIDESTMTIIRGLAAMTNIDDEDVRASIVDMFSDIQAEEANLFSPMPDYIASIVEGEAEQRAKRNRGVQPHDDVARGETIAPSGSYAEEHRAFVDPSVPLRLPYNLKREMRENPNRNSAPGTYHDVFYGDGSQCVFAPPEDNKRRQLEKEKAAHQLPRRPPISYEPAPRPTMKVDKEFVPSCAEGNSASQRDSSNPVYRRSSGFALRNSKPGSKDAKRPLWKK